MDNPLSETTSAVTDGPSAPQALALLSWYDRHHRILPWRVDPPAAKAGRRPDPYHVWLSEVMLQQTTVQTVKSYFEAFLGRWPRVEDLAAAPVEEVMAAWAGLGYYARARNLKKCVETVARDHGGRFPDTVEGLKGLPGIGDYTAAAIAAIAFNRPAAVVDGNIERVITRLEAIETPLPAAKPAIKVVMAALTPADRPGDFAQAMMDLGATICTPRRPACALCPFNRDCRALTEGDPELYPVKARKAEKPVRRGAAFVAQAVDGAVLLRRRPDSGLLGGMAEVPTTGWTARQDGETGIEAAPFAGSWREAGTIRHVFTHFELALTVHAATGIDRQAAADGRWVAMDALDAEALPTVMKKAIACALPDAFRGRRR